MAPRMEAIGKSLNRANHQYLKRSRIQDSRFPGAISSVENGNRRKIDAVKLFGGHDPMGIYKCWTNGAAAMPDVTA